MELSDILKNLEQGDDADTEVMALRISFDLVPEWSRVVERVAADLGRSVTASAEPDGYVVRVELDKAIKPRFVAEIRKYWVGFQEYRERQGEPVYSKRYRHDDEPIRD